MSGFPPRANSCTASSEEAVGDSPFLWRIRSPSGIPRAGAELPGSEQSTSADGCSQVLVPGFLPAQDARRDEGAPAPPPCRSSETAWRSAGHRLHPGGPSGVKPPCLWLGQMRTAVPSAGQRVGGVRLLGQRKLSEAGKESNSEGGCRDVSELQEGAGKALVLKPSQLAHQQSPGLREDPAPHLSPPAHLAQAPLACLGPANPLRPSPAKGEPVGPPTGGAGAPLAPRMSPQGPPSLGAPAVI